jgi:hypothetical protein
MAPSDDSFCVRAAGATRRDPSRSTVAVSLFVIVLNRSLRQIPPRTPGYRLPHALKSSFCERYPILGIHIHHFRLTLSRFHTNLIKWLDSLRVESVTTKSTHFVALPEYPRNSPHRAAWVSLLNPLFLRTWLSSQTGHAAFTDRFHGNICCRSSLTPNRKASNLKSWDLCTPRSASVAVASVVWAKAAAALVDPPSRRT